MQNDATTDNQAQHLAIDREDGNLLLSPMKGIPAR